MNISYCNIGKKCCNMHAATHITSVDLFDSIYVFACVEIVIAKNDHNYCVIVDNT